MIKLTNYNSNVIKPKLLKDYCRNVKNTEEDNFIGIKSEMNNNEQSISINFPMGYDISDNDEDVRGEILNLLGVLKDYGDKESSISGVNLNDKYNTLGFPTQAYLIVLNYYLNNGYMYTPEERYKRGLAGPINWNRTIKKEKPIVQRNGFIYTTYRVRHYSDTDKDMITDINKYCVYLSHLKVGWLFSLPMIHKPEKEIRTIISINYLKNLILKINVDKERILYQAMLDILKYETSLENPINFNYGTYYFHFIWENLIEETYGNEIKEEFFPKTEWLLNTNTIKRNAPLEPDTIMREKDSIYIIDGKYYKYGITNNPGHLPSSSSINKQITYGEYIATNDKFKMKRNQGMEIYNAFLLPFNSTKKNNGVDGSNYYTIGEAVSNWKSSANYYERVQGILVDVKKLMSNKIKPNLNQITKLAKEIRKANQVVRIYSSDGQDIGAAGPSRKGEIKEYNI